MAGVRVSGIPKKAEEKHIKIHFSKPQNGGGLIKKIYYPLFNNDAVIIFQDPAVVESLLQNEYAKALGRGKYPISIQRLPEHKVFSLMQARVDPDASVLLQTSPALVDEFRYNEEIDVNFDESTATYVLSGNWYQLEWAWTYLDAFLQQQEVIQDEIKHQPFRNVASPMDVEDGGEGDISNATGLEQVQGKRTKKSAFFSETVAADRDTMTSTGRRTVAQSLSESSARFDEMKRRDLHTQDKLQHQIQRRSSGEYERSRSPVSTMDDEKDDDRLDLTGNGYQIPDDSIPVFQHSVGLGRKSDEENTFSEFSDFDLKDSRDSINRQRHVVDRKGTSADFDVNPRSMQSETRSGGSLSQNSPVDLGRPADTGSHTSVMQQEKGDVNDVISDRKRPVNSFEEHGSYADAKSSWDDTKDGNRNVDVSTEREGLHHYRPSQGFQSLPGFSSDTKHTQPPSTRDSRAVSRDNAASKESGRTPSGETYTKDDMQYQFHLGDIDVVVLYGDLVQETTEAVVNPANSGLEHWGGASYAISKAAGPTLDKECRDYITKHGYLKVADVMHTTGGKLHAHHVLHTYGPMWLSTARKEKTEFDLTCTFLNCFNYAEKLWFKSLSVPAISTGVFGVPLEVCVRSFLDALLIFSNERKTKNLRIIHFINKDADATMTAIALLQTTLETNIVKLSSQAFEKLDRFKAKDLDLPKGRKESYGERETISKSIFAKTVSHESPVCHHSARESKPPQRRSSSLSRIGERPLNHDRKDETPGTSQRARGAYSALDRQSLSSSLSEKTQSKRSETDRSNGSCTSTYFSSSGANRQSNKDLLTQTGPTLKKTLMDSSGGTQYKIKGTKKPNDTGSPKGKIVAKKEYGDDTDRIAALGRKEVSTRLSPETTRDEFGLYSQPANLGDVRATSNSDKSDEESEKCAICLDTCRRPKILKTCKHIFCSQCIDDHFKKYKPTCPVCGTIYGKITGTQPKDGKMMVEVKYSITLPGYEKVTGAIVITYLFRDGVQQAYHPHPGKRYRGGLRIAYLPNNSEGKFVLSLLKKAFDARLVFTIGDSRTTGKDDVLTWNDIHHKTSIYGGPEKFGYPDPTYLTRVKQELADKGITSP